MFFLVPVQMKKNRPASLLRVLCAEKDLPEIAGVLFRETSTIGLRMNRWERLCLEREIVQVETEYGAIRIKRALLDGNVVNSAPEYEDCKEKAKAHGVPLKKVYQAAMRAGEV
ncbi:LarC family nickel insertion protein [bacterium]|nr:MAG: LarC family nickel insertion protein [bacterium]